ncbi:TPA: hypothetical protein NKQ35_004558 [Vibrio parahaemolyticus]|nr:hypothetical protein [Vibrio parahaemolyticus]
MKKMLIFVLFLISAPSMAQLDIEDEMFQNLNRAISNLGERTEYCRNIAFENKPSESMISYLKGKPDSFFLSLAYLDFLAMEKCTLEQKKDLAYVLLSVKHNTARETTINLIKSTEKLTFSSDYSQKVKFESLDKESKEFLLSSEFFSVPFDILELFEQITEE